MLIDEFMPSYDAIEQHKIEIRTSAQFVYEEVRKLELGDSRIVRVLFRLRELPAVFRGRRTSCERLGLNLKDLISSGFILLGERPNEEILLGLVGRFWTPHGDIRRMGAEEFKTFASPGYAKAAWNFSLTQRSDNVTRLATETRVLCLDDASRRRFKLYWALIAPFSGIIRNEALRAIKRAAESKTIRK